MAELIARVPRVEHINMHGTPLILPTGYCSNPITEIFESPVGHILH
jgi:hypothetical protein